MLNDYGDGTMLMIGMTAFLVQPDPGVLTLRKDSL
jgi:hypothetical protein